MDDEAAQMAAEAAIRRANPDVTICFAPDPLHDIKQWICGINAVAALGIILRGLLIRLPAA